MKISKYNKFFDLNGKNYIFNSNTCALAEINKSFFELFNKIKQDSNYQSDDKLFYDMIEGGVIIDNDCNEIELIKEKYWKTRKGFDIISFTILPTLNCNYNCPYCYEKKNNSLMSDLIIKQTIEFIKKSSENTSKIALAWYGGEPLLAKNVIKYISDEIIDYCNYKNKKFAASIVTNGYLIDDDIVDLFLKSKINSCQITLDGIEETHNSKRFNKKNPKEGTFQKTVDNIKKLNDAGIKVTIRFNIDKYNYNELEALLNYLKNKGITNNVNLGWLNAISDVCCDIESNCLNYKEYCKIILEAQSILIKNGFASRDLDFYPIQHNACSVVGDKSVVINPFGDLFKCWNDVEDTSRSLGNVQSVKSINDIQQKDRFKDWSPFNYEKCIECDILPICQGGCPYMALKDNCPQCSKWKYIIDEYLIKLVKNQEQC